MDRHLHRLGVGPVLGRMLHLLRRNALRFASITAIPSAILVFFVLTISFAVDLTHPESVRLSPTLTKIMTVAILGFVSLLHRACAAIVFAASELELGRQATVIRAYAGIRKNSLLTLWLIPVVIGLLGRLPLTTVVALFTLAFLFSAPVFVVAFSENLKTFEALRRTRALTTGNYSRIFLVLLSSFLLGIALLLGLTIPLGFLGGLVGSSPWLEAAVIGVPLVWAILLPMQLVLISLTVAYRDLGSPDGKESASL